MPSSRGFSEPGIESTSPASQVNSLLLSHWGSSLYVYMGFPGGSEVKRLPGMREIRVQCLGQEDSPGEGNGTPLQDSCLENPMDGGAWWAVVHGVT